MVATSNYGTKRSSHCAAVQSGVVSKLLAYPHLLKRSWWRGAADDETTFPVTAVIFEAVRELMNGTQVTTLLAFRRCACSQALQSTAAIS